MSLEMVQELEGIRIPSLSLIDQALAEKSLRYYIEQSWPLVEPKRELAWSWYLGAICEHLEAVTYGQIQYLVINIPPRHTKSLTVCVFWPTWEWGPVGMPHLRYVYSSYAEQLSIRDAVKSRRLIQSSWYQERWGREFILTSDQNQKTRYDNDKTGYRVATSVGGVGTGEGGDRIVVDDPHNVKTAESDSMRQSTLNWWDESMSSRLDNEDTGAYVIIGQRTHHNDLSGHVVEKSESGELKNVVRLILPARYEKERELRLQTRTPLDFTDPRTKEGEPLDRKRYGDEQLKRLESRMTEYARAAQLQQRPTPRGGGMFKKENFVPLQRHLVPTQMVKKSVRYWDKAGTEGGGAMSGGVKMYEMSDVYNGPKYIVVDAKFGHLSSGRREKLIEATATDDGYETYVYVEQEPGSGGKESAQNTVRRLSGFRVYADPVSGSKEARAEGYSAQVEGGNVGYVVDPTWNNEFFAHHEHFPLGKYLKDLVDAASGAFNKLALDSRKRAGVLGK